MTFVNVIRATVNTSSCLQTPKMALRPSDLVSDQSCLSPLYLSTGSDHKGLCPFLRGDCFHFQGFGLVVTASLVFCLFVCFCGGTGISFTLARQALYQLSHSTSPFLCWVFFKIGSCELFAWLASNRDLLDLCLLSS
jgi:hypothetical protein